MAIDPNLVAEKDEREPRSPPIGVLATPTMHIHLHKIKPLGLSKPETAYLKVYC
jgi:hypothetical protein